MPVLYPIYVHHVRRGSATDITTHRIEFTKSDILRNSCFRIAAVTGRSASSGTQNSQMVTDLDCYPRFISVPNVDKEGKVCHDVWLVVLNRALVLVVVKD